MRKKKKAERTQGADIHPDQSYDLAGEIPDARPSTVAEESREQMQAQETAHAKAVGKHKPPTQEVTQEQYDELLTQEAYRMNRSGGFAYDKAREVAADRLARRGVVLKGGGK